MTNIVHNLVETMTYLCNITCHESEPDLCQIMNDDECRFPNWPIMSAQCIFCLPNQLKVAF